jgi:hypothetical protein
VPTPRIRHLSRSAQRQVHQVDLLVASLGEASAASCDDEATLLQGADGTGIVSSGVGVQWSGALRLDQFGEHQGGNALSLMRPPDDIFDLSLGRQAEHSGVPCCGTIGEKSSQDHGWVRARLAQCMSMWPRSSWYCLVTAAICCSWGSINWFHNTGRSLS